MTGIRLYMEGGGQGQGRAILRQGMNELLSDVRNLARRRSCRWKLVCCGSRSETWKHFSRAVREDDGDMIVLLVDSEGSVKTSVRDHLRTQDRWSMDGIEDDAVHLMIQSMETWIIADTEALSRYYGQAFRRNALPKSKDLESVPPREVALALRRATRGTKKGEYHKIRHAPDLLKRISIQRVSERCASCRRLLEMLESKLGK